MRFFFEFIFVLFFYTRRPIDILRGYVFLIVLIVTISSAVKHAAHKRTRGSKHMANLLRAA